ncbi:MAG: reverse transcriptase/maturase family protein [Planctomycetes bacterium]|jgi:retron-type reverse transcriptase|nr:reverse transcriptase/maturase family protein [Planctomycetota bacterium]
MKIQLSHKFEEIISLENLLAAWQEFINGKRRRLDVSVFTVNLMDNIFSLHYDLLYHRYQSGGYEAFNISDPKPRNIHKASVRDRLLHHAIYRVLYPFFDRTFIADSYSCRLDKGTHKALKQFQNFFYKVSRNDTKVCWALKCDIRKFFASINHDVLINILEESIPDINIRWLLKKIIKSFSSGQDNRGLPLGNLTSQLFVNIYMNVFDQFVKHKIKVKYYIRYADDFVFLSEDKKWLERQINFIKQFLSDRLKLELHPNKLFLKTISSGLDFLGWTNFAEYKILRTKTKKRILKKIRVKSKPSSLASYLGLLKHGNTYKVKQKIINNYWLTKEFG